MEKGGLLQAAGDIASGAFNCCLSVAHFVYSEVNG
ncbi:hypothetical protein XACM_0664 [Xanthomonas euvesicatoria pv. citrumelo F1]|nr:hypothetical protein XACM_0664 [Xanthomonas euvesicatoria pv. citrumelo F1]